MANIDPAKTYTLEGFIESGVSDDMTYYNFSLIEMIDGIQHLDRNVIEEYIDELKPLCIDVPLDSEEYSRYKYNPDLLAYDIYG